jgi:hypothetical protein
MLAFLNLRWDMVRTVTLLRVNVWFSESTHFFFVNKKEVKKTLIPGGVGAVSANPAGPKVFCFAAGQAFFPKKKRLLCLRA